MFDRVLNTPKILQVSYTKELVKNLSKFNEWTH